MHEVWLTRGITLAGDFDFCEILWLLGLIL